MRPFGDPVSGVLEMDFRHRLGLSIERSAYHADAGCYQKGWEVGVLTPSAVSQYWQNRGTVGAAVYNALEGLQP